MFDPYLEDMSEEASSPHLGDSPPLGGLKMSSGLKERLKRTSRSFSSPISQTLEIKSVTPENNCTNSRGCSNFQDIVSTPTKTYSLEDIKTCNDENLIQLINFSLKNKICQNEEKLKKLELVQRYHTKNKPEDLVLLIKKWLTTSQEALKLLSEKLPENDRSFQRLLNMLNIDNSIIHYDCDNESFY